MPRVRFSSDTTNKDLLSWNRRLPSLKEQLAEVERQEKYLETRKRFLRGKIRSVETVNLIYKGTALHNVLGKISAITNDRRAEIWENCAQKGDWRVELVQGYKGQGTFQSVLSLWYLGEEEATSIALEWVAFGKRPPKEAYDYTGLFGQAKPR